MAILKAHVNAEPLNPEDPHSDTTHYVIVTDLEEQVHVGEQRTAVETHGPYPESHKAVELAQAYNAGQSVDW